MKSDNESLDLAPEDLDARKPAVRVARAGRGWSRRSLVATAEILGGVSNASAEAFRSLGSSLSAETVAGAGLRGSLLEGLRTGSARFFEELSHASERVFDSLRGPNARREPVQVPDAESLAQRIDYERLARLVAAEMKQKPSGKPGEERVAG